MTFQPHRTAIVGATGPTGYHLARQLEGRGWKVRAVARGRRDLERLYGRTGIGIVPGDALDPGSIRAAVDGCDLVVDCIGLPPEHMEDHPHTARNLAAAIGVTGARCLQVSSYWSFLPHRDEVVSEEHPRRGGHPWFRWRREAEDVLLQACAAVVHLPDFFGPRVHTSAVQQALRDAAAGKPIGCIGSPDTARETVYVPDAMRIVADLAAREEAYGTDWALPGNGAASANDLARLAGERLGREVKVRSVPVPVMALLARVVPSLRPIRPLVRPYAKPVRYDASKLRGLLGTPHLRPLQQAVNETLDHLAREAPSVAGPVG